MKNPYNSTRKNKTIQYKMEAKHVQIHIMKENIQMANKHIDLISYQGNAKTNKYNLTLPPSSICYHLARTTMKKKWYQVLSWHGAKGSLLSASGDVNHYNHLGRYLAVFTGNWHNLLVNPFKYIMHKTGYMLINRHIQEWSHQLYS